MKTSQLLIATAVFEFFTGVFFIIFPSKVVSQLLGMTLTDTSGLIVCRISGAALIALSLICWLARSAADEVGSKMLLKVLLCYNVLVTIILGLQGFLHSGTLLMWAAVLIHLLLALLCTGALQKKTIR